MHDGYDNAPSPTAGDFSWWRWDDLNLSPAQAAKRLRISQRRYHRIENGQEVPPMEIMRRMLASYRHWMDRDTFPYCRGAWPPDDGKVEELDEARFADGGGKGKADHPPSDDFRRYFMTSLDWHSITHSAFTRRGILIALACIGLDPVSQEWLDGATARAIRIPRLGRGGDWGRGWLFAHHFAGWEGAKGTIGLFPGTGDKPLSPSEWQWIVETGLAPKRWANHRLRSGEDLDDFDFAAISREFGGNASGQTPE